MTTTITPSIIIFQDMEYTPNERIIYEYRVQSGQAIYAHTPAHTRMLRIAGGWPRFVHQHIQTRQILNPYYIVDLVYPPNHNMRFLVRFIYQPQDFAETHTIKLRILHLIDTQSPLLAQDMINRLQVQRLDPNNPYIDYHGTLGLRGNTGELVVHLTGMEYVALMVQGIYYTTEPVRTQLARVPLVQVGAPLATAPMMPTITPPIVPVEPSASIISPPPPIPTQRQLLQQQQQQLAAIPLPPISTRPVSPQPTSPAQVPLPPSPPQVVPSRTPLQPMQQQQSPLQQIPQFVVEPLRVTRPRPRDTERGQPPRRRRRYTAVQPQAMPLLPSLLAPPTSAVLPPQMPAPTPPVISRRIPQNVHEFSDRVLASAGNPRLAFHPWYRRFQQARQVLITDAGIADPLEISELEMVIWEDLFREWQQEYEQTLQQRSEQRRQSMMQRIQQQQQQGIVPTTTPSQQEPTSSSRATLLEQPFYAGQPGDIGGVNVAWFPIPSNRAAQEQANNELFEYFS